MKKFTEGERVTAIVWGEVKHGTVMQDNGNGIAWVRWDGMVGQVRWMHTASIKPEEK